MRGGVALLAVAAWSVALVSVGRAQQHDGSVGRSVGLGIGLGTGGFLVGGLTGVAIASGCSPSDTCWLYPVSLGAAVGGTVGMALGVHLGNRRRGSLPLDCLAGAAVWGAGIAVVAAGDFKSPATYAFAAIPVAQLVTTVMVERASGRARSRDRTLRAIVVPRLDGGATLVASLPF